MFKNILAMEKSPKHCQLTPYSFVDSIFYNILIQMVNVNIATSFKVGKKTFKIK